MDTVVALARRGAIFLRIFMGTVGAMSIVASATLIVVRLSRISPLPTSLDQLLVTAVLATIAFQGIGWLLLALSKRLWNSTS